MGMKKPSGALIALRQRKASSNPDNATTGGHGTPTCSDVNEDNISERGERARKRVRERSCGREGDRCREGGRR